MTDAEKCGGRSGREQEEGQEGGMEVEGWRCRVSPELLVFSAGPRIKKGAPRGAANYRLDLKWIFWSLFSFFFFCSFFSDVPI